MVVPPKNNQKYQIKADMQSRLYSSQYKDLSVRSKYKQNSHYISYNS